MNTEEREISLMDLLIYVVKGWRGIIVWMLLLAIAVGGIQYVREVKNLKAFNAEPQGTEEEQKEQAAQTLEQLRKEMTDEEIKAVAKVVRLEKEYDQQLEYMESSMIMTMDPYDVNIAKLQYWVDTDYRVDYAGITPKDATGDIVDSYINRIEDNAWRKRALKAAGADMELAYFSEVLGISDLGNSFTVIIKYGEEEPLRKMIAVLEEELESYKDSLEGIFGEHSLNLVNESVETVVDNDIYNQQQSRKNNLINLENNIASYKNAFSDNQKSLYAGEILVNEDGSEEDNTEDTQELAVVPPTPAVRVKYILLGAVLGAFLVCMVRAMMYILSGRLKAEDAADAYVGVTSLGCIEEEKKQAAGAFGRLDAWIDSFSKRNYGNLTKEQQIEMVVSNISLYCEKGDMKTIYLNSSVNCTEEKGKEIKQLLKEKGLEVREGFSILQDAKALEDMSRADGVVFLEQAGKSRYEALQREVHLCKEHGKAVIGLVVLV